MKSIFIASLLLLTGCSATPLDLSEQISRSSPQSLQLTAPPPSSLSLAWQPRPIDDFIISQNADGLIGGTRYQDIAIGRLISRRVAELLGSVTTLDPLSANQVIVTIEDARLGYKYGISRLAYANLLLNVTISADDRSHSKIYYRQSSDGTERSAAESLDVLFDSIAIEIAQDVLATLI
ncbi:MAG: hypothetical protein RQ754_06835 [Desulfuromonadales bacterium]|nr:hypothetical protein [Desulfuromonadales bacterium]